MTIDDSMILLVGAALYFAPTIGAAIEKRAALPAVFAINLFLGWTFFGWVAAIVVGALSPKNKQHAYRTKVNQARDEFYLREQEKFAATQEQVTK